MLEHTKNVYSDFGKFPTKKSLRQFVKNTGLYSQVGQELVDRLLDALKRKMSRKKEGLKGGFPRFKSFDRMRSLVYPQSGFSLGEKLNVTPFGIIKIKKHREVEGTTKTLTLKREPSGKWFAVFVVENEPQKRTQNLGGKVGLDLGLKTFATLSDGTQIKNPRHLKKHEEHLAFLQRRLSRKKKRSLNCYKSRRKVALLYEKVANTRLDFLHKTSTDLVSKYSLIALEQLSSSEMSQQNYGKQINDAGWGMFANMLRNKAESAGCEVVFVDPKNTTKMCSSCGGKQDMPLSERIYFCPCCGLLKDRDVNASINILKRATVGQTESNACGDDSKESSLKQEAHTF
jgi:putative transposase